MRKLVGFLLSSMLVFGSVGFASAASLPGAGAVPTAGRTSPSDPYKAKVPPDPYKTKLPPDPYKSPAAVGVGIASCANTVTRTINPVPWYGTDVALVTACSSVTVTVSNIGPQRVLVYLQNVASGTTVEPSRFWAPTDAGTSYTWFVDAGTYRVGTSNPFGAVGYPTWATYKVVTH